MKTPREILIQRHQAAVPRLDAIRHAMAKPPHPNPLPRWGRGGSDAGKMPVLRLIWLELIFPSRRIWAGLAVVWILILAVNFSMQDHPGGTLAKATTPEIILSSPQEEQLLTELIEPNGTPVAEPKKPYAPRPSSLRAFEIMSA